MTSSIFYLIRILQHNIFFFLKPPPPPPSQGKYNGYIINITISLKSKYDVNLHN